MCRMFAYVGKSAEDLAQLYGALVSSAEKDTIGKAKHPDGWGYVIYGKDSIHHYRSGKAIFEDVHRPPEPHGEVYSIFHARHASEGNPVGSAFSHPYFAASESRLVFLAHNGSVDTPQGYPANKVDSEYVLDLIVKDGTDKGVEEAKAATKPNSALNLLILEIDRNTREPSLKYLKYDRSGKGEYYDLYVSHMRGGIAVISSTLSRYGISADKKVESDGKLLSLDGGSP